MPRRNPPRRDPPPRPLASTANQRTEGDYIVRDIPAPQATKTYRCPGCDHTIAPGTPHLVAWPTDPDLGIADRRHWHRGCWTTRHHRRPY